MSKLSFVRIVFLLICSAYAVTVTWGNSPETNDTAMETQSQSSSEAQLLKQTDHLNIQRYEAGLHCANEPLPVSWRANLQERRDQAVATCLDCKDGSCSIISGLDTLETRYCAQTFCAPTKIVKYTYLDHHQLSTVEVYGTYKISKRGRVDDVQVLSSTTTKGKIKVAKNLLKASLSTRRYKPLVIEGKKHEIQGLVGYVKWTRK